MKTQVLVTRISQPLSLKPNLFWKKAHIRWCGSILDSSKKMRVSLICKACFALVAAPQGNTTNLYQHLNRHHKIQYDEAAVQGKRSESRPKTQTSITDTLHNATPYPHDSSRSKEITEAIAYHLANDMVPIYNVERDGFQKMIHTLDKR